MSDQGVFGGVDEEQQVNVAGFVAWPQTKASTASTVDADKSECVSRGVRETREVQISWIKRGIGIIASASVVL